MGPLLWTMCEGFPQPIQDQFRSQCGWSIVSGMWYTTITLCDLCRRVQWFFPTGGFSRPVVFPGRPEPWRGRHLGTAEAVPRERLEPRPGRRPLVPIGRAATHHWSVDSALREGTLGSKAPRPLRSHAGCGPMPARARRPRAGEDSCGQTVIYGILYTTVPVHRALLSRHGSAAKPARSNV